jgi:hypothetical protein
MSTSEHLHTYAGAKCPCLWADTFQVSFRVKEDVLINSVERRQIILERINVQGYLFKNVSHCKILCNPTTHTLLESQYRFTLLDLWSGIIPFPNSEETE